LIRWDLRRGGGTYIVVREAVFIANVEARYEDQTGLFAVYSIDCIECFEGALVVDGAGALFAALSACTGTKVDDVGLGLGEELGEIGDG
jgi:hypothetical protein